LQPARHSLTVSAPMTSQTAHCVAAIYDIHGNLPALEAVLAEIRTTRAELLIVGGDVLPGPMPRESLDLLLRFDLPTRFIVGNGDREVLQVMRGSGATSVPEQFREGMLWNAQQLASEEQQLIATWPATARVNVEGVGDVLFCHATPQNDTQIFTTSTPVERLLPMFETVDASIVVCGHTHMQFDRKIGDLRLVNAGSVGMPFGEPGAYWLLLGPDIQLRRTCYDLERAADRVRATSYPDAEGFAARNILRPPSEEEMLRAFSGAN
jgi:predicted phosphodiesterase